MKDVSAFYSTGSKSWYHLGIYFVNSVTSKPHLNSVLRLKQKPSARPPTHQAYQSTPQQASGHQPHQQP